MQSIRVIIGAFASPTFASGLEYLLSRPAEFDVVQLESMAQLQSALATTGPQVLILEGAEAEEYRGYLRRLDSLSVIVFDPSGERARVDLSKPSWQRLSRLIRAIAAETVVGSPPERRIRLVDPEELGRSPRGAPDQSATDEIARRIDPLVEWLDLAIAIRLLGSVDGGTRESSVPGWAVSAPDALRLLGAGVADASLQELRSRFESLDENLIKHKTSLPARLHQLVDGPLLDDEQLRVLCFVLAPEIDGKYATAFGVLQDDMTRRRPGITLLADLAGGTSAWSLRETLAGADSVVGRGLITPMPDRPSDLAIEVGYEPRRVVTGHLLLEGHDETASTVGASLIRPEGGAQPKLDARSERVMALLTDAEAPPVVHLRDGGDGAWFRAAADAVGVAIVQGDLRAFAEAPPPSWGDALDEWLVLCSIHDAVLMLSGLDELEAARREGLLAALARIVPRVRLLVTDFDPTSCAKSAGRLVWVLDAPAPGATERSRMWAEAARSANLPLGADEAQRLGATLHLRREQMDACIAFCGAEESVGALTESIAARLRRTALELTRVELPRAVRRVETVFGWGDIVLPASVEDQLRTISVHVLYSGRVMEDWGFDRRLPYGRGVAALFSGESGTGKTMAAQIIARDLGVDLLQVDLSKTISKYIGETEKNLDVVFEAAERSNAVLLFDEADALFGKRTQVKDAHDRHANVEVAYLLQRMEEFKGLAVLTTNIKQNLDPAFLRRLRFVVEFPMPAASERERIWRTSFPEVAPLSDHVDVGVLARKLKLSGGSIQQIAIHAAFAAASAGEPTISSEHVLAATRHELVKVGMLNAEKTLDVLAA